MRESETAKMFLLYCLFFSLPIDLSDAELYTCGSLPRDTSRSFSSPDQDGDGLYDANQRCRWTIVAEEHKMIQLQVHELDIEEQKDCYNDYLAIYDGTELKGYYCGTTVPPTVRSSSRVVYVTFVSNEVATGRGFNASYEQLIDIKGMCGGIQTGANGSILSVDYDGDEKYEIDLKCVWVITAPQFYSIELTFVSIEIEWHKNCEWDYIRIFDGYDSYPFNGLTGWYCGNNKPERIVSNTNIMFIEFISDRDTTFAGFELRYRYINETITELMVNSSTTNTTEAPVTDTSEPVVNEGIQSLGNICLFFIFTVLYHVVFKFV